MEFSHQQFKLFFENDILSQLLKLRFKFSYFFHSFFYSQCDGDLRKLLYIQLRAQLFQKYDSNKRSKQISQKYIMKI